MTDKKLTDQEIIKAFRECGQKMNTNYCDECPYNKGMCNDIQMTKDILDLINRLQAENERLKQNNKAIMQTIADVHTEAIKEFAERLNDAFSVNVMMPSYYVRTCIKNTLNERVGE